MCGTASRRTERCIQAERNRARPTDVHIPNKHRRVRSLELTLEKALQLRVARRLLAIGHGERVRCVARLLHEDLRELDHVCIGIELVREVDHGVGRILLVAWPGRSKKGSEGRDRERVALQSAVGYQL